MLLFLGDVCNEKKQNIFFATIRMPN